MKNKKRTWVLLRGLGREVGHWGEFPEQMSARFPGDKIVPVDLPGAGEFRHKTCPVHITEIFQFVRGQIIERTEVQSTYHLLALSLGGMVAMEWLRQKPEDLAGCVLLNSSSRALSSPTDRLRWQIWPQIARLLATQVTREREQMLAELVINSPAAQERAAPLWTRLANEHPIRYSNFARQLLAAARAKEMPNERGVPVLVLAALGDRLVDPSCSQVLAEKMRWPLALHPWGGHDLTWDDADWVLQKIEAWLTEKDEIT